jgi:RNA polymerase sigma-70 factor (ECF subfamily)
LDDQDAIRRLKRGDIGGLHALVDRYQIRAARASYLITQDTAMAEDIMQNAFLRVYDRIDQFDLTRPFEPWLMRIVINMALQATGSQQRLVDLDALALPDPTPDPAAQAEAHEEERAVREALAALSPEQRAVVVFRYYLGYTESEMVRELEEPLGTIRWRLYAAHKRLRGLLAHLKLGPARRGDA